MKPSLRKNRAFNKINQMDTKNLIVILLLLAVVGIRVYQKYGKKNKGSDKGRSPGSSVPSSSHDDDYEPYSKK